MDAAGGLLLLVFVRGFGEERPVVPAHLLLAGFEQTAKVGVGEEVVILLAGTCALFVAGGNPSDLISLRVHHWIQRLALSITQRLLDIAPQRLLPAWRIFPLDVLGPHNFLDALLFLRPVMALAAVPLGHLRGRSLALRRTLALTVGLRLILLEGQFNEQLLIGLL